MPLIVNDILDNGTNAIITNQNGDVTHSFHNGLNKERIKKKILSNSTLSLNLELDEKIIKGNDVTVNYRRRGNGAIHRTCGSLYN